MKIFSEFGICPYQSLLFLVLPDRFPDKSWYFLSFLPKYASLCGDGNAGVAELRRSAEGVVASRPRPDGLNICFRSRAGFGLG